MTSSATKTVTFLFTDIEGSTRLLLRLGARYPQVLADHHRLLRQAVASCGGAEFGTQGDALFATFPEPSLAVEAAIGAQRALAGHDWPKGGMVRVRIGLHAGEAVEGPTGYTGFDVHCAARVADAGHGGQILISETVRDGVASTLPASIALRDLGEHRLKDLPEPVHLYQVEMPDLPSDFAPLRSLLARPNNLPGTLSEFVGREKELAEVADLVGEHRLITLLGPGGSGKTRLALRAATDALTHFTDGVFFVPLEAITDAGLVASAVVHAMGITDAGHRAAIDVLSEELADKHLLLVLDNFEQVLPAASVITRLCRAAPGVHILVTSRALLHLSGEHAYEVPPLMLPDLNGAAEMRDLAAADAVALFVRRAQAVDNHFALTLENAAAVAEIVAQLDGMPLAIELAAARSRFLTPDALRDRLENSLALLEGGPADAPDRHRTLRSALAWSYELLNEQEQAVFRRLGVFAGGFVLDAAEEVAGDDVVGDVVPSLASLIDTSLVSRRVIRGEARFHLLETLRQFAMEELARAGEAETIAGRHAHFYLSLAEEAEPGLAHEEQAMWIERLALERDNLRAALRYAGETGRPDIGLRIGGAVWRFWHGTGQLREGMQLLEGLMAHPGASPGAEAKGLTGLAGLAYWQTDYDAAWKHYERALSLYRSIGDRVNEADTLFAMSMTASFIGDHESSGPLAELAKAIFEELHDREGVARALLAKAQSTSLSGDLVQGVNQWEASLAVALEVGNRVVIASQLNGIASIRFALGDKAAALERACEALEVALDAGSVPLTVMSVDAIAVIATTQAPKRSVRLASAAAAVRKVVGGHTISVGKGVPTVLEQASKLIDRDVIEREWEEGREMTLEEAVDYARRVAADVRPSL